MRNYRLKVPTLDNNRIDMILLIDWQGFFEEERITERNL